MPASSAQYPTAERPAPNTRPDGSRLRTVTGNPFPRKCACGCGGQIPRNPQLRYVVDFSGPKPFKTYLREHSPDFGSYRGSSRAAAAPAAAQTELPGFRPASELLHESNVDRDAPSAARRASGHKDAEAASPSPEAGRPWASGQLALNAGQFESARSGFADYAHHGETAAQLRTRVNRVILEDLEQKVLALRALHEKLRDRLSGASFGDEVARGRPAP